MDLKVETGIRQAWLKSQHSYLSELVDQHLLTLVSSFVKWT